MYNQLLLEPFNTLQIHYEQIKDVNEDINEPTHEIMALIALRKLNLYTRMRSHPMGLHVLFSVRSFGYFYTLCVRTAKALVRLRRLAWAFAVRLCDKYHNLMCWLIWFWDSNDSVIPSAN